MSDSTQFISGPKFTMRVARTIRGGATLFWRLPPNLSKRSARTADKHSMGMTRSPSHLHHVVAHIQIDSRRYGTIPPVDKPLFTASILELFRIPFSWSHLPTTHTPRNPALGRPSRWKGGKGDE